jgi:hypothetical protein
MHFLELIALAFGLVGTIVGIENWHRQARESDVRLRVSSRPRLLVWQGEPTEFRRLVFSVVNLSKFPVIVNTVGVRLRERGAVFAVLNPEIPDGGTFPRKLEPRESMTLALTESDEKRERLREAVRPFAGTVCGVECIGDRRDGAELRAWASKGDAYWERPGAARKA